MAGHGSVVWDRAEGYRIFDADGNCWIDFSSSVILANAGHAHEKICQAIKAQVDRKLLHNYIFPSAIRARLVQRLVEISPDHLEKVFLLTTGSEAVECAIKLTRMHGHSLRPEKIGIVSFTNSFHGRTMGSQMIGGFPDQKAWIVHLDPAMHQIPFPFCFKCPWGKAGYDHCGGECFDKGMVALSDQGVGPDRIAGFVAESFQGPTVAFMPEDYVRAMRRWADAHQALVVFDEIQAGFGRSGKLFAFEQYGIEADLICCGKGITGSLPLSAVFGRARIMDIPDPGQMSSTHTGNPLCCAAALANLDVIEEERLVERAAVLGRILGERLNDLKRKYPEHVGGISGRGLAYAVYLIKPGMKELDIDLAQKVTESALRNGLFMLQTCRGTLKIAPPLSIPEDALIEGVDVIDEAMGACVRGEA
jgi:4-aminobutyrate aminotransferase/diaminobutyrate-pyruvate transaminase/4-aminobutyrate aminotransferase/(S)-3-amino-2-methylpropionate transaminase